MIPRISLLAVILVAACSTPGPPSQVAAPTAGIEYLPGPGPYQFDCDAPSSKDRVSSVRLPTGSLRVTGQLQFLTTRDDPSWNATAEIHVMRSTLDDVVLTLWVRRGDDKVQMMFARVLTFPNDFPNDPMASMRLTSGHVPFALTVDPSGKVSASVGGVAMPVSLHIAGSTRLMLECSTARVHFSDVAIAAQSNAPRQPLGLTSLPPRA